MGIHLFFIFFGLGQ
jgi:hypothetical protein